MEVNSNTLIYNFSNSKSEKEYHTQNNSLDKSIWGGKGSALITISRLGIDVPPGFVINTSLCSYVDENGTLPSSFSEEINSALNKLEEKLNLHFGDPSAPLLLSVRSGAPISMPGMMDTVLNIGINDEVVKGLAEKYNDERFAYDSYRRLLHMFGSTVMGVDGEAFEYELDNIKNIEGVINDGEISAAPLKELIEAYKRIIIERTGEEFPQDVRKQMYRAIIAVIESWKSDRAVKYREMNNISSTLGTAITVQSMVFGNMGEKSCTGVVFTRNPSTGENTIFGEFLINAQGEDIVSGIRNSFPINEETKISYGGENSQTISMEKLMPEVYMQLSDVCRKLEDFYKDMQDIEFTVEEGKLWILQSRSGKRSSAAAIRIAYEMEKAKIINEKQALKIIPPQSLEQMLHPSLNYSHIEENAILPVTTGMAASPGSAVGMVAVSAEEAESLAKHGKVILVRNETSPDDMAGIAAASGIITARGGMTSHAAVVARGMGKPCVCGAHDVRVDEKNKIVYIANKKIQSGTIVSIDGTKGTIYLGELPLIINPLPPEYSTIEKWIDSHKLLSVRANAETKDDLQTAIRLGASGVGLCRTEHMFFAPERILYVRKMILANSREKRLQNLSKLEEYQKEDFKQIFNVSSGLPVTIRLLDPPLHEFLPHNQEEIKLFSAASGMSQEEVEIALTLKKEHNPMLGHRGCRLAITYPEIYEMQVRAIFRAIYELVLEEKTTIQPEIMIPLVSNKKELLFCKRLVDKIYQQFREELPQSISQTISCIGYKFGAMIELPCAALQADELASVCDFLSFGTNDLTQTTLGLSRDDSSNFMNKYLEQGLISHDPFITLEKTTVGKLLEIAVVKARSANPRIKIGICGEHGGDPESIYFVHSLGLDYISCSPYRIPLARLAAAQA